MWGVLEHQQKEAAGTGSPTRLFITFLADSGGSRFPTTARYLTTALMIITILQSLSCRPLSCKKEILEVGVPDVLVGRERNLNTKATCPRTAPGVHGNHRSELEVPVLESTMLSDISTGDLSVPPGGGG